MVGWLGTALALGMMLALPPGEGFAAPQKGGEARGVGGAWVKQVSEGANFALYIPSGWRVQEGVKGQFRTLYLSDPGGEYGVGLFHGRSPAGEDGAALARIFLSGIGRDFPDLQIRQSLASTDKRRIFFDGQFTHPQAGKREFRYWISCGEGNFVSSVIEAPGGKLDSSKPLLLTVLSNVHILKGAYREAAGMKVPLVERRLRDGSARFQIPPDWRFQDHGTGAFAAEDPSGAFSFVVASVQVIEPRMGVRGPGVLVSPYLPPHQALKTLAEKAGVASEVRFLEVRARPEVSQAMARAYTAGPVLAEEFLYTHTAKGRRCKGYTFGVSFGSHLKTNWRLWHVSVGAPLERFDSHAPAFADMFQSYRIDDAFAREYIARGAERLRQMQRQTGELVSRNAEEIRRMMQAAFDERSRSMDYIDYQRTRYLRGEQDWISRLEGGTIYRSDRWGTQNTATGERWEGQPYNYFNFQGESPKVREGLTPIDSRALWEKHGRGR